MPTCRFLSASENYAQYILIGSDTNVVSSWVNKGKRKVKLT